MSLRKRICLAHYFGLSILPEPADPLAQIWYSFWMTWPAFV